MDLNKTFIMILFFFHFVYETLDLSFSWSSRYVQTEIDTATFLNIPFICHDRRCDGFDGSGTENFNYFERENMILVVQNWIFYARILQLLGPTES